MSINPMASLYNEFIKILNSTVIKYNYIAEENENLSTRKISDLYFDAVYERDTFYTYRDYTEKEMRDAGMVEFSDINNGLSDPSKIPKIYHDKLLAVRRKNVIKNYNEPNNYYRMLNGYPDLDDLDFVYVDSVTATKYNVPSDIPIHRIEDELGTYYISALESIGYINKLVTQYPNKSYLNYIGTKRINIVDSRKAKNFTMLYVDPSINESILTQFKLIYDQCREYYVNTIYVYEYRNVFSYYDNFIGMCIMVMALQQFIARTMEMSIRRDFFDTYAVQLLYSVYGLPFNSKLDSNTQKAIVQNLNILIQNKATNKVIYDIASLLGYDRIEVFCYYLMKERKFDSNGRPVVATIEKMNEDTGEIEEVYDYEGMFDVHFQKVQLRDYNYHQALEDSINSVSYDSITTGDPFWWEDDEVYKEVWESEYNFKESKYLGITVSYKLSEIMYENIILLRMIMDKKQEIQYISIDVPKLTESGTLNLFDSIITLCALTCKKYNLTGEIIASPSKTLHVLDALDHMYYPNSAYDCLSFNFKILEDDFNNTTSPVYEILNEDEREKLRSYLSILSISSSSNAEKVTALNSIYSNIKGLAEFLTDKISETNDIDHYRILMKFYRTIFYTKATNEAFQIMDGATTRTAKTYLEYIQYTNPEVYELIETTAEEDLYVYINHIISGMEEIINDINYLYIMNDSTSSVQEILIELIKFFKSYTTDLLGLNIVYIFDFKIDNLLKLIDKVENTHKTLMIQDKINLIYADNVKVKSRVRKSDPLILRESFYTHSVLRLGMTMVFKDVLEHIQKINSDFDDMQITDSIKKVHVNARLDSIMALTEAVFYTKRYLLEDPMKLIDKVHVNSTEYVKDQVMLTDTVTKVE